MGEKKLLELFQKQLQDMLGYAKDKRNKDLTFDGSYDRLEDEICGTLSAFEELQTKL